MRGSFFIWFHIRSSHMIYFICIIHLHIFHGNIWTQNWPAPNVSGFIAQLVERRTGIARSRVQAPLKSWIFFRLLYAIAKLRNHLKWSACKLAWIAKCTFNTLDTVFIYLFIIFYYKRLTEERTSPFRQRSPFLWTDVPWRDVKTSR